MGFLWVPRIAEGFVKDVAGGLVTLSELGWLPVVESLLGITDSFALNKVIVIALNLLIDNGPISSVWRTSHKWVLNVTELFTLWHSLRTIALQELNLLLWSSFSFPTLEQTVAVLGGKIH